MQVQLYAAGRYAAVRALRPLQTFDSATFVLLHRRPFRKYPLLGLDATLQTWSSFQPSQSVPDAGRGRVPVHAGNVLACPVCCKLLAMAQPVRNGLCNS